jgi:hypothetical protein
MMATWPFSRSIFASLPGGVAGWVGLRTTGPIPALSPDVLFLLLVGVPAWVITIATMVLWLQMRERHRVRHGRRAPSGALGRRARAKSRAEDP